jgi:hypothetical protein
LVLIGPPVCLNVANSFGSVWPGTATVVLVVSEAVARRMSGCNPDVEKTAQPGFADCGQPSGCGNAQISVGPLISEHGLRRAHLGFLRRPRLDGLLPNPWNVTRDSYRRRSLLAGGLMFRLVIDGVPASQVQIRAAYHIDSGTDRGLGCLGSVWSIRM